MIAGGREVVVQIPGWKTLPWLRHGFSTRFGGVSRAYQARGAEAAEGELNTGWTATDLPENVAENRSWLITAVMGTRQPIDTLITVRQVHSARTLVVPRSVCDFFMEDGRPALEADGLMTHVEGKLLGIQTADCVPVLVVDTARRVVAAFHAGWRGTVARIVEQGVAQMMQEYGSQAEDLQAAVGPSIGGCCYSVGGEVRDAFANGFAYADDLFSERVEDAGVKTYLDLWEANRRQLLTAGVTPEKIFVVGECSGCAGLPERRTYFSHRCENGFTGRMMSVIGVVEK